MNAKHSMSTLRQREPEAVREEDSMLRVLRDIRHAGDDDEHSLISVEAIRDALGDRLYGPLFLIGAALQLFPTGMIMGITDVVTVLALLTGLQMCVGRAHPWLPRRLLRLSVSHQTLEKMLTKVEPWARKADHLFKKRATFLVVGPASIVVGAASVVVAVLMFFLGFLPGAANLPALALLFFAIGLTVRDGVANLIGLGIVVLSTAVCAFLAGVLYAEIFR